MRGFLIGKICRSSPGSLFIMAKRAIHDVDGEMDAKAQFGQRRMKEDEDVDMGEFEDPWEDELEEEEGEEEITVEADDEDEEDEGTLDHRIQLMSRDA